MNRKIDINIICTIFLMLVFGSKSMAQDISIELTIRWGAHVDEKGNSIQAPFLDITYVNNSSYNNYYFLKQSRANVISNPLPEFYNDQFEWHFRRYKCFNHSKEEKPYLQKINRSYSNKHFFGEKYYITIDNERLLYYTGWSAKKDTAMPEYYEYGTDLYCQYFEIDREDTTETEVGLDYYDEMQYALVDAYDSMYISNYGYNNCGRETFSKTEFTDSTISNSAIDNFVFLKTNEKYTTSYNLYGLKLVGGNFEFLFRKSVIPDEVCYMEIYNSNGITHLFMKLPQNVNGYQLYSGKFKTNHAFLEIKE